MRRRLVTPIVVLATVLGGALWLVRYDAGPADPRRHVRVVPPPRPIASPARNFDEVRRELEGSTPDADPRVVTARARRRLRAAAGHPEKPQALLDFMRSGSDAPIADGTLEIGPGSRLVSAPTLRVLVLDELGRQRDDAGSAAAIAASHDVLRRRDSADEWAVALRNLAWLDPSAQPLVVAKLREMLRSEWRHDPSGGFLEAFDLVVHYGDARLIADLAPILAGDGAPDTIRAAAIALDRLSQQRPLDVMRELSADRALLAQNWSLRADYFARADLSDAEQRGLVERHLLDPGVSAEEKNKLLRLLPDRHQLWGDYLVTSDPEPRRFDADADVARRAVVRATLESWLTSPAFAALHPQIETVAVNAGAKTRSAEPHSR